MAKRVPALIQLRDPRVAAQLVVIILIPLSFVFFYYFLISEFGVFMSPFSVVIFRVLRCSFLFTHAT